MDWFDGLCVWLCCWFVFVFVCVGVVMGLDRLIGVCVCVLCVEPMLEVEREV